MIKNLFQLGEPVEHRGIVVAPVFPLCDPVAAYVTLDEALASGLRVREVDESGSVPELVVENPLDWRVLLYDGEELVGAKQNRILNVSVGPGSSSATRRSSCRRSGATTAAEAPSAGSCARARGADGHPAGRARARP